MKIDWWTLGLQTINVLVLLWVLQRFLLKPVQAMIAQRQKLTQQLSDGLAGTFLEREANSETDHTKYLSHINDNFGSRYPTVI